MKLALVDNMNNNFFSFARYLKDSGVDVSVYETCFSLSHFSPKSDTFKSRSEYNYLKKFPNEIRSKSWLLFKKKNIYDEFSKYDLIVSCGLSSAYLVRAGLKVDIIIPHGGDLYSWPFKTVQYGFNFDFIKSIIYANNAKYQKKAFIDARVIITDDSYSLCGDALKKLKLKAFNFGVPMLYNKENLEVAENINMWRYLDNHDFVAFNHSRQLWSINRYPELTDFDEFGGIKRNDKVLQAFSMFIKKTKFESPLLVLFEYGNDIDDTKALVKTLEIENYVKWMPITNRKNIMYGLAKASLATNAFRENMSDIGGVCYESFACGVPVINNCVDVINDPRHKFFNSPMIHALSEDDILNIFIDYESDKKKYIKIGEISKKWFDENLGVGLAKKYIKLMNVLSSDYNLTQNDKEVKDILCN
jgi:glycosyltransferase involved in cell wall biosynthesis